MDVDKVRPTTLSGVIFGIVLYAISLFFAEIAFAGTSTITTGQDFRRGVFDRTEATSREGELKLSGDGSWSARSWRTPFLTLNDGTTFTNDGVDTYMLIGRDVRFVKYIPTEDRWKELAAAPHMANSGADMVVLGDYIYVVFGGYQKFFSRYSISQNSWSELTVLPDFPYSGSSIQTDGTDLYILRGANTSDFWKYTTSTDTFSVLAAPPAAISAGADLIFDDSQGTDYLYTPRGANQRNLYQYNIAANSWTSLSLSPAALNDNGNITKLGGAMYMLRGGNTNTMYKYVFATDTWSTLSNTPALTRYVGMTYNPTEDLMYVFRGNGTYEWWKYDPDTDTYIGPTDLPGTPGSGADIIYAGNYLYYRRGNNSALFYRYNIASGVWETRDNAPGTFNDDSKGIKAGDSLYFFRGSNTNVFYRFNLTSQTWTSQAVTPANTSYGSSLAYPGTGDYIYAVRGALTGAFWRYSINGDSWDDVPVDLPSDMRMGYGARLVSDGTDVYAFGGSGVAKMYKYSIDNDEWTSVGNVPFSPYWGTDAVYYDGTIYVQSGFYKTDFWAFDISSQSWRRLPDMAGYYAGDIGPYNGGSIASDSDSGVLYSINGANITRLQSFSASSMDYPDTGTWLSDKYDLSFVTSWDSLVVTGSTPGDSSYSIETRSSTDKIAWSSWQSVSGSTIASPANRYLQIRVTMHSSSDNIATPTIYGINISYQGDTTAPSNPNNYTGSSQAVGGISLTSGNAYKYTNPYFTWSGASDGGVGIAGYYVYYGTNSAADPVTDGTYQAENYYTVTKSMSTDVYYLIIKTKDVSNNISEAQTGFVYEYEGVSPPTVITYTTTEDFSLGNATNVNTGNNDIKLTGKTGFWQQYRLSAIPGGAGYGASFAYVEESNMLYAFRGQNTTSFYSYDIDTDTWTSLAVTPGTVYQGGELVEGPDGYLYGFPGKNITTFWRYDIANNTWSSAADAPLALYYGSAMIYDGDQYIYVLRGNTDDAFMKYDTSNDTWEVITNVNFGSPTNQIDNNVYTGGDLTYDQSDTIYALQGNARTGFSSYSIASGEWSLLPNVPVLPYDGAQISYDEGTQAVYFTSGWTNPFIYKYDIATQTWTKVTDAPMAIQYGGAMKNVNGMLYVLRGGNNTTFWRYNIAKSSWQTPNKGLFGTEFRGTDYRVFGYGSEIVKGDGNYYYMTRGYYDNLFVRYDAVTGESTMMAMAPGGFYTGSSMVYEATNNKIYAVASSSDQNLYVYDISTDTWSLEVADDLPVASNVGSAFVYDGSRYLYWTRGNSNGFYRYDTQASAGSRWSQLSNTPASIGNGGDLSYRNGNIYALRGGNTLSFYRYDVGAGTWSDPAVSDLPTGATMNTDSFLVKSGNDSMIACRGANVSGCYQYTISTDTWASIENPPMNINQGGAAASDGMTRMMVIAGNGATNTYNNGLYSYIIGSDESAFEEQGTYVSPSKDLTAPYKFANITLDYTAPSNTSITVETRTSADNSTFSSWSEASELKASGSNYTYKVTSAPQRYLQVRFTLNSSDGVYSGVIHSYNIEYYLDATEPSNPSVLSAYDTNSLGVGITSSNWYNYSAPYFDWSDAEATGGASDSATGSGVIGYYIYFGTDVEADPYTDGTFSNNSQYQASGLTNGETYYLRIKTKDDANNVSASVWQPYVYKYDSDKPSNPSTLTADPPGYTSTNSFTFSWSGATDDESEVYGYCYKTGEAGFTEVCTTETSISGITAYRTGVNTFYVRTIDNAGNYSNDYVTASYYYSSTAPSAPQNLTANPTSSTDNEFAFTWSPPSLYYGAQSGLRYYYSVNAFPTANNVNSVGLTTTYLTAGPYATQKGGNILYVVAKDEAGNIDYNSYASVSFTADTSAPGIPLDIDIADVSVKESASWKLAISWEPPTTAGSGISVYKVYSSTTAGATCTDNFDAFSYISSTTGKSYVDTDLEQQTYAYCVKACTSTNDCSAASSTVELYPDGKWRVAPTLVGEPDVTVQTKAATVMWHTGRKANSFVKYGKNSGDYGAEVGSSELVTTHEIDIEGLDPGTTYYYKVLWTDEDGNTGSSDEYTFTTNAAPYVSNVSFTNVSLYEAYVNFTVKNATKITVQYGKTEQYGAVNSISTSKSESTYTVKLEELTDGSLYNVRIAAEDEEGNEYLGDNYTFETLPVPKITALKIQQVEGMATATFRLLWVSNTKLSSIVTYYPTSSPQLAKDSINLTPTVAHQAIIKDLLDETEYTFLIKGEDAAGNEAVYQPQKITTSADLRPPSINNANVETTIVGVGEEAKAQIIISWDTDEGATSQIEYGEGTSGEYTLSTQEDASLTSNHSMTIPGLTPSKIYHFRIKSKDKNGNIGYSEDIVVITPNATQDALNLVVDKLSKTFGFLKKYNN